MVPLTPINHDPKFEEIIEIVEKVMGSFEFSRAAGWYNRGTADDALVKLLVSEPGCSIRRMLNGNMENGTAKEALQSIYKMFLVSCPCPENIQIVSSQSQPSAILSMPGCVYSERRNERKVPQRSRSGSRSSRESHISQSHTSDSSITSPPTKKQKSLCAQDARTHQPDRSGQSDVSNETDVSKHSGQSFPTPEREIISINGKRKVFYLDHNHGYRSSADLLIFHEVIKPVHHIHPYVIIEIKRPRPFYAELSEKDQLKLQKEALMYMHNQEMVFGLLLNPTGAVMYTFKKTGNCEISAARHKEYFFVENMVEDRGSVKASEFSQLLRDLYAVPNYFLGKNHCEICNGGTLH